MRTKPHWGIVGGGLLGMTLAWELAKAGNRVSLFEAAPEPGGLASAWRLGDIVWDRHYHVTLASDFALRALLAELDLEHEMRWCKTHTGFYWNGHLWPLTGAWDFARLPLLNSIEKLRFGRAVYRAARHTLPLMIEQMTVEEWLTEISGRSVFDKLWQPLLRAKLGDDWRTTSALFMWATIQRMFAARRSGLRAESFGYLPGGYGRMLDRFVTALRRRGVCVYLNMPAREVACTSDGKATVEFADAAREQFDRVVVTVPAPLAARLCPGLSEGELQLLRGVQYLGIVCLSLLLRRPLSPFYITNIADASIPLTGVIEMSNLVDSGYYGGRTLVYLPRYVRPGDCAFQKSDTQIQTELVSALRQMHPALGEHDILAGRVSRVRYVFARPSPGSTSRIPPIDTSQPGVHILNSAHIVAGTLNVNETVQLARTQARRLHELAA